MEKKLTQTQFYDAVLNHAYQSAFRYKRPVNGYIRDIGFSHYTWNSLRNSLAPTHGKLALFVKLATDYINEKYGNEKHEK